MFYVGVDMWTQYKARTRQFYKDADSSTITFWINEHGEVDMENINKGELSKFLLSIAKDHNIDCEETGNTFKEEE